MKKLTYAQLAQRVRDLESQSIWAHRSALRDINKTGEVLMASAAVLTITGLGGKVIVAPVAIVDGFSEETISAIKRDIERSLSIVVRISP